eukprot:TRINITY_DN5524_c0_g2_i1.p1 TRINITY_DN5524_c0_g2~~TRINITY_DN5524_c0_g2_i1.p1  ORF type:complete len:117 (-),score=35.86 TRINITY_DN5524_c0_g2_i1:54-404(-)
MICSSSSLIWKGSIMGKYTEVGLWITSFELQCLSGGFKLGVAPIMFNVLSAPRSPSDDLPICIQDTSSDFNMTAEIFSVIFVFAFIGWLCFIVAHSKKPHKTVLNDRPEENESDPS